jgi:hypothetical protein
MGGSSFSTITHKKKIRSIKVWPLNPKAMDNKTRPSNVYIAVNLNKVRNEEEYTKENEVENNR